MSHGHGLCEICGKTYPRLSWNQVRCNPCSWVADRHKGRAHREVKKAIGRGDLADLSAFNVGCVDCGERATVYDHRDYSAPTSVDPLCHRCNLKRGPGKNIVQEKHA